MVPHLHYKDSNDYHIMLKPTQLTFIASNYISTRHNIQFQESKKKKRIEDKQWACRKLFMGPHFYYKGTNDHHIMLKLTQLIFISSNYVSTARNIQFQF